MSDKVLIVGAGPSVDYDFIRNFDGIIVCVDRILKSLLAEQIEPDYCVTYEKGFYSVDYATYHIDRGYVVMFQGIPKVKTQFIYSPASNDDIVNGIRQSGHTLRLFEPKLFKAVNNVGLFGFMFAVDELKASQIHLIGFDHLKTDFPERPIKCQWMREVFFEIRNGYCSDKKVLYVNEPI